MLVLCKLVLLASILVTKMCFVSAFGVPTGPQLRYVDNEIAALTHFNMQTFSGGGNVGCGVDPWNKIAHDPSNFKPTNLNVSNWIVSMKALGAKHAILTAKHNCGFLLWETKTTLPSGEKYGYGVMQGGNTFPIDVVDEFVQTAIAAGLGVGFYYSTGANMYLNRNNFEPVVKDLLPGQVNVSDAQYKAIVLAHLEELWSRYANMLTEIWFDGGYGDFIATEVTALLATYQPQVAIFNGFGIATSPVRWIGNEFGFGGYPIWSTGTQGSGNPNSTHFVPAGCDTTLNDWDAWFFDPSAPLRSLSTLIDVYQHSVGQNCVLELDFAIDTTGNVHPVQAQLYAALGSWVRNCFGSPIARSREGGELYIPAGDMFDRFILMEDQSLGERISSYSILVNGTVVGSGSAVGHKRIHVLPAPMNGPANVTLKLGGILPIMLRDFSAYRPCPSS